jgi:DNA polymerase III subunit epsilon
MELRQMEGIDQFAVFDTETSLVSGALNGKAYYDAVEVGIVLIRANGDVVDEYSTLIRPVYPFNAPSCHSPHITKALLAQAPTYAEVIDSVIRVFESGTLAGQNVQFDRRVIATATDKYTDAHLLSAAQNAAMRLILDRPMIDTRKLYRALNSDEVRIAADLDSIAESLGLTPDTRAKHNALDDARLTARVLTTLLDNAKILGVTCLEDLVKLQQGSWGQPEQVSLF